MTNLLPGTLGALVIAVPDFLRHMAVEKGWGESRPSEQVKSLQQSTVAHMQ